MDTTLDAGRAARALTWPQRAILSEGWRRRGLAFAGGAFGALALEPVGFTPAMVVPLTLAVWLLDGAIGLPATANCHCSFNSARAAAADGWWLGFGYFLAGLWWLGAAMLVEADKFAWALPLAVLGVPAGLALFTAVGFYVARQLWSPGWGRLFALVAGLGGAEWLRGHILTGFPWNGFGMALTAPLALGQSAALVGVDGLSLAAIFIFAAPATLIDGQKRFGPPAIWLALMALVGMAVFGIVRLSKGETAFVDGVKLRLMQPNLPQDQGFRADRGHEILRRYLALSDQSTGPSHTGVADATHIIWPESALPFILSRDPMALADIALGMQGKILITGAARLDEERGRSKIYNAVQVVQGNRIIASFDKKHLVPFGEYLPFASVLGLIGVRQLVPGTWDVGEGPRALSAPGAPLAAPLVCYEAIFSGAVVEPNGARPQWLLNVTNDGWFGRTSGPYQHFAQARLRAIEEGLPLVRVATTGVSAVVDSYGRVLEQLPIGVEGVIDSRLPASAPPPFFALHGSVIFIALWSASALCALFARWRGSSRTERDEL